MQDESTERVAGGDSDGDGALLPWVGTEVPGPRARAWVERLAQSECPALTARRKRRSELTGTDHDPIVWTSAHGAIVRDVDDNRFIDLTAGFGVAMLGHSHPSVLSAIERQTRRMVHALGDVFPSDRKVELEERLSALAPWPNAKVILGLSGADGVEAALKSAVLATKRAGVIAFEGGYHGLAHGPLAACGYSKRFREPFAGQLNADVRFVAYPAREAPEACSRALDGVRDALASGTIGAVLVEPVQGRGGVTVGDGPTLSAIVKLAREAGAVVIADEIYTGCFRCADAFCASTVLWNELPDVVVLGKALGGGLPVSACLLRDEVAEAWGDPAGEAIHTSTFLGNPLACAAALAVVNELERPSVREQIRRQSELFWSDVIAPVASDPSCRTTRTGGAGLLVGLGLEGGLARVLTVMRAMLERGYIVLPGGVRGDQLAFTPPAVLSDAQRAHARETLRLVLRAT
ncbi:MAG: aminotransferase class III-fold pyridoxal phosphate-dependent enzyme [Myxococcales bacterium]|nr:aminotransferase class III-fold pyridoxal phosphate-dependent enzyme [Myxococcales bacterium]